MPRPADILRPLAVAAAAVAMAGLTWRTWPDAIYDYGGHLYIPWRLSVGQRLYADVAYFNGPLSEYANAALFRLFGVGLMTVVWANLAILAGVLAMVYRLAGTTAAVVAATVFAFGQYVGIGNYNWACPYTHEVTHGVALGLAAVAAVARFGRTGRRAWLAAAGAAVGLCALTKAEVSAAAVVAVGVGTVLAREAPGVRPGLRLRGRVALVVVPAAAVVLVAFSLLTLQMGSSVAALGVAGAWPWVFDRRVVGLAFYRKVMGTDDVAGNLGRMAVAGLATAAVGVVAVGAATRRWRVPSLAAAAVGLVGLAVQWPWVQDVARPWPVLVAAVAVVAVERAWRGPPADRPAWVARATLAVFAGGLLAKMALAAQVSQYGFTLALPAAAVLCDAAVRWGPARLTPRGLDGRYARGVVVGFIAVVVAVHVHVTLGFVAGKRTRVGTGSDAYWADARGVEVNAAVAAVASARTVAVMPQGLTIDYLARRVDPLRAVNVMPPELASVGEDRVLADLARHPPDVIVVVAKDAADGGFLLTEGHYVYGRAVLGWVREHYRVIQTIPGQLRLTVMRRR